MKIPKKLKVGGHWYTVKYPHSFSERDDLCGQHDCELLEIRLTQKACGGGTLNRAESDIAVTFLHEILHAIDKITGHKSFSNNESALQGTSELLFQVLRDNKLRFDEED